MSTRRLSVYHNDVDDLEDSRGYGRLSVAQENVNRARNITDMHRSISDNTIQSPRPIQSHSFSHGNVNAERAQPTAQTLTATGSHGSTVSTTAYTSSSLVHLHSAEEPNCLTAQASIHSVSVTGTKPSMRDSTARCLSNPDTRLSQAGKTVFAKTMRRRQFENSHLMHMSAIVWYMMLIAWDMTTAPDDTRIPVCIMHAIGVNMHVIFISLLAMHRDWYRSKTTAIHTSLLVTGIVLTNTARAIGGHTLDPPYMTIPIILCMMLFLLPAYRIVLPVLGFSSVCTLVFAIVSCSTGAMVRSGSRSGSIRAHIDTRSTPEQCVDRIVSISAVLCGTALMGYLVMRRVRSNTRKGIAKMWVLQKYAPAPFKSGLLGALSNNAVDAPRDLHSIRNDDEGSSTTALPLFTANSDDLDMNDEGEEEDDVYGLGIDYLVPRGMMQDEDMVEFISAVWQASSDDARKCISGRVSAVFTNPVTEMAYLSRTLNSILADLRIISLMCTLSVGAILLADHMMLPPEVAVFLRIIRLCSTLPAAICLGLMGMVCIGSDGHTVFPRRQRRRRRRKRRGICKVSSNPLLFRALLLACMSIYVAGQIMTLIVVGRFPTSDHVYWIYPMDASRAVLYVYVSFPLGVWKPTIACLIGIAACATPLATSLMEIPIPFLPGDELHGMPLYRSAAATMWIVLAIMGGIAVSSTNAQFSRETFYVTLLKPAQNVDNR